MVENVGTLAIYVNIYYIDINILSYISFHSIIHTIY